MQFIVPICSLSSETIFLFQKTFAVLETWLTNEDMVSDPGRSQQIKINLNIDVSS